MPVLDFECSDHGPYEAYRSVHADVSIIPPCPAADCQGICSRDWRTNQRSPLPDAVVVYQAPDGSYRFPGDPNGLSAAQYSRQGYTRIEARGWAQVRQLERQVEQHESRGRVQQHEQQQRHRELGQHARRSELFHLMPGMSRLGREVARLSIDRSNARALPRQQEAGFHVEAYSNDRSNREESRDSVGRRRRD